MSGKASRKHLVCVQIIQTFLFMALLQHAVDDALVLDPEDGHLAAGNRCLQTLAQVADEFGPVVNDFESGPGSLC